MIFSNLPTPDNPMVKIRSVCLFASLLLLASCTPTQNVTGVMPVAEELVRAFNSHDPEAMGALVAPDFELFYVDESGEAVLSTTSRDQLIQEMKEYFAGNPSVQSAISASIDGPRYVSFREQIVGGQSSIAVYEIHDQLIKRVWYYPAE